MQLHLDRYVSQIIYMKEMLLLYLFVLIRHDERISTVEEKQKEILLEIANFKANYLVGLAGSIIKFCY